MTTIFERLGLPAGASAAEIVSFIGEGGNCQTENCPPNYESCRCCDVELLTAALQRERLAGKREAWKKVAHECVHCCHESSGKHFCGKACMKEAAPGLPPCVTDDGCDEVTCRFEICPLMKGE